VEGKHIPNMSGRRKLGCYILEIAPSFGGIGSKS